MRNYFKELDEYLIKNKPEIWLTKCHCYIPIAFFILIFVLAFQIFLPTCFNIYIILTSTSIIAIILFVLMLRNQFVYFNKNFNENQLLSIYGINFLAILLFSLIAIGPPYLFGKRAFSINENRLFAIDKDNIRIAMIKYDYIKTIKNDNKFDTASLRKLRSSSQNNYDQLIKNIKEIQLSKFINQDLANINFSDKNDNNFTNAFREKVNDSHELKDTNVEKSVEDYWNNGYIKLLKDIDSNKVVKIKSNINEILEVYNFKKFQGSDLSFNLTNPYFEELNQQIINFYTSINWVNSFNGNSFPLFFFMLDSILALLTIMILINIKLWEKLFAFLFFIFFYKITASLVELENKYTIIFYCVFVFLVAYKSNFWKPQKDYFPLQVILMLSLHQYLFFILYLVLLTTVESAHKFLLLSIPLYLFVVFKINKKFMKYYFWINNTPKKYG